MHQNYPESSPGDNSSSHISHRTMAIRLLHKMLLDYPGVCGLAYDHAICHGPKQKERI